MVTEGDQKAEVCNTFFVTVFNSQASFILGTQSPELKDRNGEQN